MPKAKILALTSYSDPGHGWLKVPCKLIAQLKLTEEISSCSYLSGSDAYLEEDRDLSIFQRAARDAGYELKIRDVVTKKGESRIRSYPSYSPDSCQERAVRPAPAPGLVAEYAGATYSLTRNLGRKGWEVTRADGLIFRLKAIQLAHARLRHP